MLVNMSNVYALLVDGDNINPARMEDILNDVQERGRLKTFRIYADFSKHTASSWKPVVESHACDAVQVYSTLPRAVDLTMSLDGLSAFRETILAPFASRPATATTHLMQGTPARKKSYCVRYQYTRVSSVHSMLRRIYPPLPSRESPPKGLKRRSSRRSKS